MGSVRSFKVLPLASGKKITDNTSYLFGLDEYIAFSTNISVFSYLFLNSIQGFSSDILGGKG